MCSTHCHITTCCWYCSSWYEWTGEYIEYIRCYWPTISLPIIQTILELSSTLHKYLDDQIVQETWNNLQENVSIILEFVTSDDCHSVLPLADGMLWSI